MGKTMPIPTFTGDFLKYYVSSSCKTRFIGGIFAEKSHYTAKRAFGLHFPRTTTLLTASSEYGNLFY